MGSSTEVTDVTFSRWGEPVDLALPPVGEVDTTPGIDEEGLARFDDFALLAPRRLPDGLWLVQAMAPGLPESIDIEMPKLPEGVPMPDFAECGSATLMWAEVKGPPANFDPWFAESPMLTLNQTSSSCPADPGSIDVAPEDGPPGFTSATRNVDGVRVEAWSNLPQDEVTRLLSDLVPFDLAAKRIHEERFPGA